MTSAAPGPAGDVRQLSRAYWERRVDALHRHSDEGSLHLYAQEMLALLPHGGTLLDVGCGSCQLTTYLAPAFERIEAIDSSGSMLTAARERITELNVSNIATVRADATSLPYRANLANAILAYGVIQYLDEPALRQHLSECFRVLAPGGVVCWALIPNRRLRWMWQLRLLSRPRPPFHHVLLNAYRTWRRWRKASTKGDFLWDGIGNWFDADDLEARASEAGFEMVVRHSWLYEYRFHAFLRRRKE